MSDNKTAKKAFNTPINGELLSNFKQVCKELEIPMNTVIEVFMRDFNNGRFVMCTERDDDTNKIVFGFKHIDKESI